MKNKNFVISTDMNINNSIDTYMDMDIGMGFRDMYRL